MINVKYHPELMEQAVRLYVRQDAGLESALHKDIDPIYDATAIEERDDRFTHIFAGWFKRLRLDGFIDEALSHFPLIVHHIRESVVHIAPRSKLQGADLFVPDGAPARDGMLVIQLCPESLVSADSVRDDVLRELQHVEDMLNPEFGYEPDSIDGLPSHQQTTLERYRLLWDIRVERILIEQGLLARSREMQLRGQFERAFFAMANQSWQAVFDRLWDQAARSHGELLRWANDPRLLLGECTGSTEPPNGLSEGAPCPVCSFPTFDWYKPSVSNKDRLLALVRQSLPEWELSTGLCRQCAETFLSAVPSG